MLSRIFVSLLILSALTSDGTINLTEYFFGSYLYVDTGLSVTSEKGNTCSDEEKNSKQNKVGKNNDRVSFDTAYSSSYIIDVKDKFINAKNNLSKLWIDFNYIMYQDVCLGYHSKISFRPLSFKKDKDIVLNSSDLSPPNSVKYIII